MQTTRELLLALAGSETRERGFAAVSYGDLARLAEIRKPSIHHHFPAKADLGFALIDQCGDQLAAQLTQLSAQSHSGGAALRGYITRLRQALGHGSTVSLLTALAVDSPRLPEVMREPLVRAQAMVGQWVGQAMLRGRQDRSISVSGDPVQEGLAVYAQLTGAEIIARAARDPALFDKAVAPLRERIYRS